MRFFILILIFACTTLVISQERILIDSDYTLEEALEGSSAPFNIKENLKIIDVEYYSFDGKLHRGQLILHKELEQDIKEIFAVIKKKKFPVARVIPIVKYRWSDEASMQDNNTSAFNYRFIKGKDRLSNHAAGRAIDINPFLNPQITGDEVYPAGAAYNPRIPGSVSVNHFLVKEFKKRGWKWGGNWKSTKDYQHFEKL